jgi:hypothetical protein
VSFILWFHLWFHLRRDQRIALIEETCRSFEVEMSACVIEVNC